MARLQAEEGLSNPVGLPASTKGPSGEGREGCLLTLLVNLLASEFCGKGFYVSILVTLL